MANAIKNVTVPLSAQLNMNRNESLTTSSYDIFNKCNSPLFGGCISPLHYKVNSYGDAKYDRFGTKWSVSNNVLYKDDVAFRDFSSTHTFEDVDTGLDMDCMAAQGSYYVGLKVENNVLSWYRIESNFSISNSGTLAAFSENEIFKGAVLKYRDNDVYLLYGWENVKDTNEQPEKLVTGRWNGAGFTTTTTSFRFRKLNHSDTTSELRNVTGQAFAANTDSWFFTLSRSLTNQFAIGVFRKRPNGVNTFKSVYFDTFLANYQLTSVSNVSFASARSASAYFYQDGSRSSAYNRYTLAFPVDNTDVLLSVGHYLDTNEWTYVRMMSFGDQLVQNGNADSRPLYRFQNGDSGSPTFDAVFTEGDDNKFAEIDEVGSSCLTVNSNGYGRLVIAGFGWKSSDESSNQTCPVVNNLYDAQNCYRYTNWLPNGTGQDVKYAKGIKNAGVTSNASMPTTKDGWISWWKNKETSDNTCWNPAGYRGRILTYGKFYALYNGKEGNFAGISYSESDDKIGTLLTAWGRPVQTFEPCCTSDKVVYKDSTTNTIHYIVVKNGITLNDIEVAAHYVLIRCSADENIYDSLQGKWAKFANDWNNRAFLGYADATPHMSNGALTNQDYDYYYDQAITMYSDSYVSSAAWAAGYDVAYQKEKGFAPSRLFAYTSLSGVVGSEVTVNGCTLTAENGLDFFYSSGTSAPSYKTTLIGPKTVSPVSNLAGSVYPITSSGSAYFNLPIIGSEIVNSYNGKYGLKIGNTVYTIAYDGVRPVALYNTASIVDTVDEFFIVQSQYYAVINGYISAISYSSSNTISGVEQIVDVTGMKFIGAFPSCAYFYSPSARAIYAFTGDADLQLFVQTDRITDVYGHLYAPNNEWIYLNTNDGCYIMTQNNTFRVSNWNIKKMFATDDDYNVLVLDDTENSNLFVSLSKKEGYSTLPIELETAFFGEGDMKKSCISEWYIRVWKGDEAYNGKVKCTGKTLTDIVKENKTTVEETLTKEKWDANGNCFITYRPEYNLALGQSCKIVSDYPIAYFGFQSGSDGSTNKSKYNL